MGDKSAIQWTDATWNPVRGCTKVSPGCAHCYAETFAERFRGVPGHPYEQGFDLRLVPEKLTEPLRWRSGVEEDCARCIGSGSKNNAIGCGACRGQGTIKRSKRIFVNSMSDLFQDGVPDTYIADVWATMARTPQHTYQILTKRADRMLDWCQRGAGLMTTALMFWDTPAPPFSVPYPLPNVWLGVSVESQLFARERIPLLKQTPAAVRFISAEPLLGPLDLAVPADQGVGDLLIDGLDWVIIGGESGPHARPFQSNWARVLIAECRACGVPCFMKQLGSNPDPWSADGSPADRKGGDMDEWAADLRVREFPP